MKITKISQQVQRKDRYSVYVDEKYSFSLSDYQLITAGLSVGKEFTEAALNDLIHESQFGKAYERALNYVMIRPRSVKEIQEYLTRTFLYPKPKMYVNKNGERIIKKKEVDKSSVLIMIGKVLERLEEKGYTDDQKFAEAWVRSRQLTKKSSKRKLQQELQVKGVSSDIITNVLSDDLIDETENLKIMIQKKQKQSRYQDTTKLTQYLLRQGFSYSDIKDALETIN